MRIGWLAGIGLSGCGEPAPDLVDIDDGSSLYEPPPPPLRIEYGPTVWETYTNGPWAQERAADGCEPALRYDLRFRDELGVESRAAALVAKAVGGPGPHPVPEHGTDGFSIGTLTRFEPVLGVEGWVSRGSVWVEGVDGAEPAGLRFEGGDACTPAGCSPLAYPLVFTTGAQWPSEPELIQATQWADTSGLEGPSGLPLCP